MITARRQLEMAYVLLNPKEAPDPRTGDSLEDNGGKGEAKKDTGSLLSTKLFFLLRDPYIMVF